MENIIHVNNVLKFSKTGIVLFKCPEERKIIKFLEDGGRVFVLHAQIEDLNQSELIALTYDGEKIWDFHVKWETGTAYDGLYGFALGEISDAEGEKKLTLDALSLSWVYILDRQSGELLKTWFNK